MSCNCSRAIQRHCLQRPAGLGLRLRWTLVGVALTFGLIILTDGGESAPTVPDPTAALVDSVDG